MSQKVTFTKGDLVKSTKSAELAALLEQDGWAKEGRRAAAESASEPATPKRGRRAAAE